MRRPEVVQLIELLKQEYGQSYLPYGTCDDEEEGTGFRIAGIEATFSVMWLEETPSGMFDVQIESYPPGDYLYTDAIEIDGMLSLVEKYWAPLATWPAYVKSRRGE